MIKKKRRRRCWKTQEKITKLKFHVQEKTSTTTTTTMVFRSGVLLLTLSHLYQNTEEEIQNVWKKYTILSQNHRDPVRYRLHKAEAFL